MSKTFEERAKEAQEKIVPILKELSLDIGATPAIRPNGTIGADVTWLDVKKEPVIDVPTTPILGADGQPAEITKG